MENLIKETSYVQLFYEPDNELIIARWLPETKHMNGDGLREQFSMLGDIVEIYQPKLWIADLQHFFFMITPELQRWTDQKVANIFQKHGMQKMVMLFPSDVFLERLAVEELTEQKLFFTAWETRFFTDETKAREWLYGANPEI